MTQNNDHSNGTPRVGVYICHCGINIASKVAVEEVVEFARTLPRVSVVRDYKFMCSDPGQDIIQNDLRNGRINRAVVASCSPLMHEPTFRQTISDAGQNPFYLQMANIREHVSWVTADGIAATTKAKALIAGAVRRVALHRSLEKKTVPVHPHTLVVGGGIAGIHAALTIANSGKKVYLVEREPSIGGHMAQFDKTFPTLDCSACILTPKMTQVRNHDNIELLSYSEVEKVDGYVGNFDVTIRKKARFVKEDLCNGCGECAQVCPVEAPSEFDAGLSKRKAIFRPFPQAVPNKFTISRKGTPPCQSACAIHQNAQGYVTLVAKGKYEEALEVILRDNPLPSVCGRVCTHPCTVGCTRSKVDEPLNVPGVKRFVLDWAQSQGIDYKLPTPETERRQKVAIVGSGPAGLVCAYELRQMGYQAEVFESAPVAGGMLALGIPDFRLPKTVLRREIRKIEETGIKINLSTRVGPHGIPFQQLRENYDAVFVAVGAHVENKLKIPGENLRGIWGGVDLLRRVNLGEKIKLGRRVIVVGGGNSAIDAARVALRIGAEEVRMMYRRTRAEMPADPDEIREAEREGIIIDFLAAPKAFLGDNWVTGGEFIKMKLGAPDESWRPRPVPIPGSEFIVSCDEVIYSIGQTIDLDFLDKKIGLGLSSWGGIVADPITLETNLKGVFSGGDCVSGPEIVVTAMGAGRKAANSIHRFLNNMDMIAGRELEGPYESTVEVDTYGVLTKKRVAIPVIDQKQRKSFEEVHVGYSETEAREEALRCLHCADCCNCRLCTTVCEPKAIDYEMQDEQLQFKVGAIVLATGFSVFDATRMSRYGYHHYPEVYTSLQVERMVNSSGPTFGEVLMHNGQKPGTVGIIHCVGSRDEHTNAYCSRVCCMYSLKLAHLVKERTGAEVFNFYIDMRTPGKGYEEFYKRLMHENVHFIRGRVAEVTDWAVTPDEEGKLVIRVEDTLVGIVRRIPLDMVVLSVGMEPQKNAEEVRRLFNISCSSDGWFLERHPKLAPVSTFTDGIFIAGTCQGPKDIPDTVAQAGAAAAEALALIDKGFVELEPNTSYIIDEKCSGCKTCVALCPYRALSFDALQGISVINEALCKGCGTCVAACPSGAMQQHLFQDEQIYEEIKGVLSYV